MITARYINEGATLILECQGQRHGIPVTTDTEAFCAAAFREHGHIPPGFKWYDRFGNGSNEDLIGGGCGGMKP